MLQTKITSYLNITNTATSCNKKRKIREDEELETGLVKRLNNLNLKHSDIKVEIIKNKIVNDYIIFKHQNIDFIYNIKNDSYSVVANKYIPIGTLLILENAIIGTNEYIFTILKNKNEIIKELYPRDICDSFNVLPKEKLMDKISHNVWEWNDTKSPMSLDNMSALCPAISKFNHSCKPNAFVRCFSNQEMKENENEQYKGYIYIYATSNILESTEITVSYGFNIGHSYLQNKNLKNESEEMDETEEVDENGVFNWICKCNKDKKERFAYYRNAYKEAKQYWLEDKELLIQLINNKLN